MGADLTLDMATWRSTLLEKEGDSNLGVHWPADCRNKQTPFFPGVSQHDTTTGILWEKLQKNLNLPFNRNRSSFSQVILYLHIATWARLAVVNNPTPTSK